jgi:hypothetical protein
MSVSRRRGLSSVIVSSTWLRNKSGQWQHLLKSDGVSKFGHTKGHEPMSMHVKGRSPTKSKSSGNPGLSTSLSCGVPYAGDVGSPYRQKSKRSNVPAPECRRAVLLDLHDNGKVMQHRWAPTCHPVMVFAVTQLAQQDVERLFRDIDSAFPHTWNPVGSRRTNTKSLSSRFFGMSTGH